MKTYEECLVHFIEKWTKDSQQRMSDEKRDGIIHCQADLLVEIIRLSEPESGLSTHPV